jgi:hypothetical protein
MGSVTAWIWVWTATGGMVGGAPAETWVTLYVTGFGEVGKLLTNCCDDWTVVVLIVWPETVE